MPSWDNQLQRKQLLEQMYPVGTRIELICMGPDPRPIESGTRGTIVGVDDMGDLLMQWDNGRTLALVPGEDEFRILTEQEWYEEHRQQDWEQEESFQDPEWN